MNAIAELHTDREGRAHLRIYEGNYDTYRAVRKAEESAAHRRVNEAKNEARKAERERVENQIKLDRNVRRGRDFERSKRKPGLAMGLDKNSSERSAGKLHAAHESMVADARAAVSEAQENLRVQERIYLELAQDALPAGRKVLELQRAKKGSYAPVHQNPEFKSVYTQNTVSHETQPYKVDYSFRDQDFPGALILTGPEHLRITGANGSGKTMLLNAIAHANGPDYRSPCRPLTGCSTAWATPRICRSASRLILNAPSLKPCSGRTRGRANSIFAINWRGCCSGAKACISILGSFPG